MQSTADLLLINFKTTFSANQFCYVCQDEDLAMIAAQQYYVEYGSNVSPDRLQTLLGSYVPDSYLQKPNGAEGWLKAIVTKLRSSYFSNERIKPEKVREGWGEGGGRVGVDVCWLLNIPATC